MGDGRRTYVFDALVVIRSRAEILEESFTAAEQDRHNRKMHFIDEPHGKVLPDGGCAAPDQDIKVTCCFES